MDACEVVERFVTEVLNRRGTCPAEELISDPRFRQQVAALHAAFPDLEIATRLVIADGDLVAGHFTGTGTHSELFAGVPPTGRRWEADCTAIYRVTAGRISEAWVTWDQLSLLEQLGAIERVGSVSA